MKKLLFISFIIFLFAEVVSAQSKDTLRKTSNKDTVSKNNDDKIYTICSEPPSFSGGDEKMYKWLGENIKYPFDAINKQISGVVIIHFVIEKDGSISSPEVLKGIGGGCDEEALRVVKIMPKWKYGKNNGNIVRVAFNLPIKFSLN